MLRAFFKIKKSKPEHSIKISFVPAVILPVSSLFIIGGILKIFPDESAKTGNFSFPLSRWAYFLPIGCWYKICCPLSSLEYSNGTNLISFGDGYVNEKKPWEKEKTDIEKEKTIEIVTPEWIYHYDLIKKEATKSHNPTMYILDEYSKLSQADKKKFNENAKKLGKTSLSAFNGKFTANAKKIMGYNCDKTEMMGTTVFNIHNTGITLKSSTNMMGIKMNTEAVKIDKGKVDEKKFELPQGITPTYNEEADKMAEQVARNEVHSIVEGKIEAPDTTQAKQTDDNEDFKNSMKKLKSLFGN